MHVYFLYGTLRLLLFLAVAAICYLAGLKGVMLIAVAAVVSAAISFFALRKPRQAVEQAIHRRAERKFAAREAAKNDADAEDEAIDEAQPPDETQAPGKTETSR